MTGPVSASAEVLDGLADVLADIDAANATDPNMHDDGPLAFVQGQRATHWLAQLEPDADLALQVAARAHHLYRWQIARADYPDGRSGYLQWRRDNKAHQADATTAILHDHSWPVEHVDRVRELLGRTKLRTDHGTQRLEDVACLVFLETQFAGMVERTDHDHLVSIVAKTLRKMSPDALALAGGLPLTAAEQAVVGAAAASLSPDD